MRGTVVKLTIGSSIAVAVSILVVGFILAENLCDPHWLNRAGAALVVAEGMLLFIEYLVREKLNELTAKQARVPKYPDDPEKQFFYENALRKNIRKAERQLLVLVVGIMMLGQILHGFGDLILKALH